MIQPRWRRGREPHGRDWRQSIGFKEREQLESYANVMVESGEFGKDTTQFDLYLVSREIAESSKRSVQQPGMPPGCFMKFDRARLLARTLG